jgi:DNA-binding NarL/FixJ family response regulator
MEDAQFLLVIAAPRGRMRESLLTLLGGTDRIRIMGVADSVPGALNLLSASPIQFVLIDSELRDRSAWLLLGFLKATRPDVHCLFLATDFQERARARQMGADMVLIKGFRMDELFKVFTRIFPVKQRESVIFRLPVTGQEKHA